MKKGKKIVGVMLIVLILSILIGNVYALSFKFNVTADKKEAKAGDEVAVKMEIADIDMGELGINAIEGILEYDDSIFEIVRREDIETKNNWTMTYNEEAGAKEGNFLVSNIVAGIKSSQEIGTIKFRIRKDAKQGETEIKFKGITSNDGGNLVKEEDKKVVIKIVGEKVVEEPTNTNTNTNILKPIDNTVVKNNTVKNVSQNDIPYTGGVGSVIKVAVVLVGIAGVVAYIKYKEII